MPNLTSILLFTVVIMSAVVEAHASQPVCVVSNKANLRAAPSPTARLNWVVGKYMPLELLETKGQWARVRDFRGVTHWVLAKNVSSKESCVVVKVRTAPLREGPGTEFPASSFRVADRYASFRRLEWSGDWVRIEDDYRGNYWTKAGNVWFPLKRSRVNF